MLVDLIPEPANPHSEASLSQSGKAPSICKIHVLSIEIASPNIFLELFGLWINRR